MTSTSHRFGRFELRPAQRNLLVDGQVAALGARAFDVLVFLVEHHERVVSSRELFDAVWPSVVVEENNLRQQIAALRKVLGANAIVTVPGRGYRFAMDLVSPRDVGASLATSPREADSDSRASPMDNLPPNLPTLIGRDEDLASVVSLLTKTHLLTLTGAGGVGKTRLALAVAETVRAEFEDGICVVELAPLADPSRVAQTVAAALAIGEEPGRPLVDTLLDDLRHRRLLIVLDNCEHLVDACAAFAERVLGRSGATRILATSREALEITGEVAWRVPSLRAADPEAEWTRPELMAYPATWLFLERAAAADPAFELTAANMTAVAQICHRLDGIPLALELAAARLKAMRVGQIAERIRNRFGLLDGGSRTAMQRHRTLRSLIDWSHDLLAEQERVLLRRLSVFAGGWTLEAAEAVCSDEGSPPGTVMESLTHLVEKSLVSLDARTTTPRYRLLETIRQYARARLVDSADEVIVLERHFETAFKFATALQTNFYRHDQSHWYAAVDVELGNIRAALEWSLTHGEVQRGLLLVNALHRYWVARLYWREAVAWLERLLAVTMPVPQDTLRATSLLIAGHIANYFDPVTAKRLVTESLPISRALDDTSNKSHGLWMLGWIESRDLDERVCGHFEESTRLALASDTPMAAAHAYAWHGAFRVALGHYQEAKPLLQSGIEWADRIGGDATLIGRCEGNLAQAEMLEGNFAAARMHLDKSYAHALRADNQNGIAEALWLQGRLALRESNFVLALDRFGDSVRLYRRYPTSVWVTRGVAYLMITHDRAGQSRLATRLAGYFAARRGGVERVHTELGSVAAIADYDAAIARVQRNRLESAFESAWSEGFGLGEEDVVRVALEVSLQLHPV